jgi:hypothetical protein
VSWYQAISLNIPKLAAFNSNEEAIFNLDRDLDLSLFPNEAIDATRIIILCVPQDDYVLVVSDVSRDGFDDGFIEVAIDGERIHRVDGNFGYTVCTKFGADGIKADKRSGSLETDPGEFGEAYRFDASGQDTTVVCRVSAEPYLEEPVPIMAGRYMRVAVSLSNPSHGVCINDVSRLDIALAGSVTTVFPAEDVSTVRFSSEIIECRGESKLAWYACPAIWESPPSQDTDLILVLPSLHCAV